MRVAAIVSDGSETSRRHLIDFPALKKSEDRLAPAPRSCRLGPTNLVASALFSFQRTGTAKTLAGSCLRGQKKPRKSSHAGYSTIPPCGSQENPPSDN